MLSLINSHDINSNNDRNKLTESSIIYANYTKKLSLINLPVPYGSIPKRNKKPSFSHNKKCHISKNNLPITKKCSRNNSISSAPYPFFSSITPNSSSFLSIFTTLFNNDNKKEEEKPVGFMPRTTTNEMSQLVVDVASSPIECFYYGNSNDGEQQDSVSSSSSSSESSLSSIFSFYVEDDNTRNSVRNNGCSKTSVILSDILCDHYVQTQMINPPSSSEAIMDVPLETFRMFEAPSSTSATATITNSSNACATTAYDYWMTIGEQQSTKEWTLVEERKQVKQQQQPSKEQEKAQEDESEDEKNTKEANLTLYYHTRDIRANAAYLRMIVAEVNMMRSQKIVGPLRPRRVLPKRLDRFMHRPSPLANFTIAA